MKANELSSSDYLKGGDVTPDILVTIETQEPKNMAKTGEAKEVKLVLGFEETDKQLVCNITNFKKIAKVTGEEDSEDWIGKKIVLWFNEDIEFGGEAVGGIRVRAPKNQPKPETKTDDDMPF